MPNHLHGIIWIISDPDLVESTGQSFPANDPILIGAHGRGPLQRIPRSLGSFIAGSKSSTTKRINTLRGTPKAPVWQRNYYDHVIRNEEDLERHRLYILENPLHWELDEDNTTTLK